MTTDVQRQQSPARCSDCENDAEVEIKLTVGEQRRHTRLCETCALKMINKLQAALKPKGKK